jgi:alpha-1,6-mannosyltransferase
VEPAALRLRIHLLGAVVTLAYLAEAFLSYAQAPQLWREEGPRLLAFLEDVVGDRQASWLHMLLFTKERIVASYWIPLGVASVAVLLLFRLLLRRPDALDERAARLLFRWPIVFAAACILAYPVFTQDLWLSAVWGRMIAAGLNPYETLFTPALIGGLPLDHFPMPMSYGPLWGLVSAAVTVIAADNVIAIGLLSKALLAALWIGALALVARIAPPRPLADRCLAVAAFGWLPLSVTQTVAEGHNDIAMVALALLWLLLLLRGRAAAPLALAASVLAKFVTAPLFLLDAIYAVGAQRIGWRRYLLRMAAPAALGIGVLALFLRSDDFFDGLRMVNEWRFLRPRDALATLEAALGLPLTPLAFALVALFPAIALHRLIVFARAPGAETLIKAALAIMAALLFSASAHVWPWYLLWLLAPAALIPGWWLARFALGVAVMAPFMSGSWWVAPFEHHFGGSALALYGGAIAWAWLTRAPRNVPALGGATLGPGPSKAGPTFP